MDEGPKRPGGFPVTRRDIDSAQARIAPFILPSPLLPDRSSSGLWLKAECLQVTGSFKVRGAANRLLLLPSGQGVVTASSGNHGQAVAYMARQSGRPATVVVPETVAGVKAAGIVRWGARLVQHGQSSEERVARAQEIAQAENLFYVPPYDDPAVVAGQGTIGLELRSQLPDLQTVLVPVSGGGLIAGVALAIKSIAPHVTVIGVEPLAMPRFARSRAAGRPVCVPFVPTVADGLRVVEPGTLTWPIVEALVDRFVQVSDEAMLRAVRSLALDMHLVVEPSGAAAYAAALAEPGLKRPAVAILSGGNVDAAALAAILAPPRAAAE
jgi:threonine dehydratase